MRTRRIGVPGDIAISKRHQLRIGKVAVTVNQIASRIRTDALRLGIKL
jgi:hypothetical protein